MQPIVPNAVAGPGAEPGSGAVASSSAPVSAPERGRFVFGLFRETPKADEALQNLRTSDFDNNEILLICGCSASWDSGRDATAHLPPSVIAAGTQFAPLLNMLERSDGSVQTFLGVEPRITHQITDYLDQGGAMLIVAIRTAAQERLAARTLLTCKCDVLLTHEVATKV